MSTKLFVGGLPWATDDAGLRKAFEPFGTVLDAKVVLDRETNRSRGFGFVTFANEAEANTAVSSMDGGSISGRRITVRLAQDAPPRRSGPDRRPPPSSEAPRTSAPPRPPPPPSRAPERPYPPQERPYPPQERPERFAGPERFERPERREPERPPGRWFEPERSPGFESEYKADDWGDTRRRRKKDPRDRRKDRDDDW